MRVALKVVGGSDLKKRLDQLPHAMSRKVQVNALKAGAAPIRDAMEAHAPRSDGGWEHLADHIVVSVPSESRLERQGLFEQTIVEVGPEAKFFHGYFQEFGTAFHPAQAFARPAFDQQSRRSLNIVLAEAWAAIRKQLGLGGSRSTTGGRL
jgi:HK97 gp10 family phage protein